MSKHRALSPSIPHKFLGLDPGLNHTGWGIIEAHRGAFSYRAHGVVHTCARQPIAQRLSTLYQGLDQVFTQYQPDYVAVEETFMNSNAASSLKLGLARGVVLLVPGMHQRPVTEYAANTIKKSVVGSGHATKDQVALMVCTLLNMPQLTTNDGSDALAVALCHAHHSSSPAF